MKCLWSSTIVCATRVGLCTSAKADAFAKSLLRSLAVSWGCHPTYRLAHLKTKMRTLVYLVLRLRFQHSGLILTGHGIYTAVSPLRWSWWTGSPSSTKRTEIRLGTTWQVGAILSEGNGLPKLGGTKWTEPGMPTFHTIDGETMGHQLNATALPNRSLD